MCNNVGSWVLLGVDNVYNVGSVFNVFKRVIYVCKMC